MLQLLPSKTTHLVLLLLAVVSQLTTQLLQSDMELMQLPEIISLSETHGVLLGVRQALSGLVKALQVVHQVSA